MKKKLLFYLILIITLFISCNTTDPPPPKDDNRKISLTFEDASCTEVWIQLTTENLTLPAAINILQNDSLSHISILSTPDSLLYIDSLLPNKTYTFKAEISGIQNPVTSNQLQVTTLDTTSQNFTFETYEFGEGSSSYFNDVWIFDETNIWACGDIDLPTGFSNFMLWDGQEWKARYPYFTSSGVEGIWALDSSHIYFAAGGIIKYENGNFSIVPTNFNFTNGQGVSKLWGSSENNIYGVGPAGTIVHYDGQTWKKIEFDTQWRFYEITGNKETGIGYGIGVNQFDDCIIIKLENLSTEIIYQKLISEIKIYSWTITEFNNYLYIPNISGQSSIYKVSENTGKPEIIYEIPGTLGIVQSFAFNKNDIYYFGQDFSGVAVGLLHYNGFNYKTLNLSSIDPDNQGGLYAIKDLAVSVGYSNNKGYLIIIKRG